MPTGCKSNGHNTQPKPKCEGRTKILRDEKESKRNRGREREREGKRKRTLITEKPGQTSPPRVDTRTRVRASLQGLS